LDQTISEKIFYWYQNRPLKKSGRQILNPNISENSRKSLDLMVPIAEDNILKLWATEAVQESR